MAAHAKAKSSSGIVDMFQLAAYAVCENNSRGRRFKEPSPHHRTEFQRDRDRIVHSAAFRRLEYKTQVFVNHEGDMYRTRLTHSLEVAQIGRAIARILHLNEDLTESIALAHDLGHTPFGHAGQEALNHCMQDYGGFEHNLQSLRVVDELEEKYADFNGLNLSFETREGILKHCSLSNARILGEVGERFIKQQQPSLEAQLVNLADEIAYNSHDVDDGLRAGLITIEQLLAVQLFREQYEHVVCNYPDLPQRRVIHEVVRRIIDSQVSDLVESSRACIGKVKPQSITDIHCANDALISFGPGMKQLNQELKRFLRSALYRHYRVLRMSIKAEKIVSSLFEVFMNDARLLPPEYYRKVASEKSVNSVAGQARVVADYIAGMTDRYAISEYERMFNPMMST